MVVQFVAHDAIEHVFGALQEGSAVVPDERRMAWFHVAVGLAIFALAAWRVALRLMRGVPPLPEGEHPALRFLAHATHGALYLLILGMPVSGAAAWFLGSEAAAAGHSVGKNALFVLVLAHLAGALFQGLVLRSNVLLRMVTAEADLAALSAAERARRAARETGRGPDRP